MSFFHPLANPNLPIRHNVQSPSTHPSAFEQSTQSQSPYSPYCDFSQPGDFGFVDLNCITQDDEIVYDSQPLPSNGAHFEISPSSANLGTCPPPSAQVTQPIQQNASKRPAKRGSEEDNSASKQSSSPFHWDNRTSTILLEVKRAHEIDRYHAGIGGRSKTLEEQRGEVVAAMAGRGVLVDWKAAYDKWKCLITVHKEIADWERHTPSGKNSYWLMSPREKKDEKRFGNLNFDKDIFDLMERYYGHDPVVNPPPSIVDSSNNIQTPSTTTSPGEAVDDSFERTPTNGGIAKKASKRMHVYDVDLKEATRDIANALEAAKSAKIGWHKEMIEIERTKVEIGLRSAMGREGLSNALNKIADKV